MPSIRVLTCLLGIGALAALACGSEPEGAAPAPPTSPTAAAPPVPVPTAPGLLTVELPSDFPADVPTYPGARLESVMVDPGAGTMVSWTTDDSAEDVLAFFTKNLKSNGWWIENDQGGGVFASKETRTATVMIDDSRGGTHIDLMVTGH